MIFRVTLTTAAEFAIVDLYKTKKKNVHTGVQKKTSKNAPVITN